MRLGGSRPRPRRTAVAVVAALGVALLPALAGPARASVTTSTRTATQGNLSVTWAQGNPDRISGLTWRDSINSPITPIASGGPTCNSNGDPQESFGQSYDAGQGDTLDEVVAGSTGTWTSTSSGSGASAKDVVTTTSSAANACFTANAVPVSTTYTLAADEPNQFAVSRTFDFGSPGLSTNAALRAYVPRMDLGTYSTVVYPTTAHSLGTADAAGPSQVSDWAGGWYADNAADGHGLLVLRDPGSTLPAALETDNDSASNSNNSSIVVHLPHYANWSGSQTETEYLCFYDSTTWPTAARNALDLPTGCGLPAGAVPCTDNFVGGNGDNWFDAANWSNGLPTSTDVACLAGKNVDATRSAQVATAEADAVENGSLHLTNGTLIVHGAHHPSNLNGGSLTIGGSGTFPNFEFDGTNANRMSVGDYVQSTGSNTSHGEIDVAGNFTWSSNKANGPPAQMSPCQGVCQHGVIDQTAADKSFVITGDQQQLQYAMDIQTSSPATISNPTDFTLAFGSTLTTYAPLTLDNTDINSGSGTGNTTQPQLDIAGGLTTIGPCAVHAIKTVFDSDLTSLGGPLALADVTQHHGSTIGPNPDYPLTIGAGTLTGTVQGLGTLHITGNVDSGGTIAASDVTVSSGTLTLEGDTTYTAADQTTLSGGTLVDNTVATTGALSVSDPASSLYGIGSLAVDGDINWTAGSIGATNQSMNLSQTGGHTLSITGGDPHYLYNASLATDSPVTLATSALNTYKSALTTTGVLTPGDVTLSPNGDPGTTFTAASLDLSNTDGTYGFTSQNLVLTGATTTVGNGGTLTANSVTVRGGTLVDNATVQARVTVRDGGTLAGSGRVDGDLTDGTLGTVAPGGAGSTGTLTVTGTYTQSSTGRLALDFAGTSDFDQLVAGGTNLGGTVRAHLLAGFSPSSSDTFDVLNATDSVVGTFVLPHGWQATYGGHDVTLSVDTSQVLDHLALSPATATVQPGHAQDYTATGYNAAGGSLGDVTDQTTFTIAGGSCTAASCSATAAGDHTVTGTDGDATGTATLTVGSAPTGPTISISQNDPLYAGGHALFHITAGNTASAGAAGPTFVDIQLPAGEPAGQSLRVLSTEAFGWMCRSFTLGGRTTVDCRNAQGIAAQGSLPPISLDLAAPATAGGVTDEVTTSERGADTSVAPGTSGIRVLVPRPAQLATTLLGADQLSPGGTAYRAMVANTGSGPTDGPLSVSLPIPAGVTAVVGSSPWTCHVGATISCTLDRVLPAGQKAPPIPVTLTGRAVAADAPTAAPVSLMLRASSTGATGPVTASNALTVARPVPLRPALSLATGGTTGAQAFTVRNTGDAPSSGPVVVTENLPAGFTATVDTKGTPWTCAQQNTTLTCTANGLVVPAGGSVTAPTVTVTPPAGVSGSFPVQSSVGNRGVLTPATVTLGVPSTNSTPPTPVLGTGTTLGSQPLYAGEKTTLTLTLNGDPNRPSDGGLQWAAVVPQGVTITGSPSVDATLLKPPDTGTSGADVATSEPSNTTCATANNASALLCARPDALPADRSIRVSVPITVSTSAASTLTFASGLRTLATLGPHVRRLVGPVLISPPTPVLLVALANEVDNTVGCLHFSADAGAPQDRVASIVAANGTVSAVTVSLDGSKTSDVGRQLSYGWVQTSGPTVQWTAASTATTLMPGHGSLPKFPAGTVFGSGRPRVSLAAFGAQPSFTAPTITHTTDLGFRLYATDGSVVSSADTAVTLEPLPDAPPIISSVTARDPRGRVLGTTATPPAGTPVTLTVVASDPEGDPITPSVGVLSPSSVTVPFQQVADSRNHYLFHFNWPGGVSQLSLQVKTTDGHVVNGAPVASFAGLVIGPNAPPLSISVAAPATPVTPGATVHLHADLANPTVNGVGTQVSWSQLPSAGPLTLTGAATQDVSFVVPAAAAPGDSYVLAADATRGTNTAERQVTVSVGSAAPLSLHLPDFSVDPSGNLPLSATVTGGIGTLSYSWSVLSGGGQLSAPTTATPIFTAPAEPGVVAAQVVVSDAHGHSITAPVPIAVGTLPTPDTSASGCAAGSVLKTIYDEAGQSVSDFTVKVGPLALDLGHLTISGTCDANASVSITGAHATLGPVTLSGIGGTIDGSGLHLDGTPTLSVAPEFRLGSVQVTNFHVSTSPSLSITGTATWTGTLPLLPTPSAATTISTSLALGTSTLALSASAQLFGGTASMNASVELDGSNWQATVSATGLNLFGQTLNGTGQITDAGGQLSGSVTATWTNASTDLHGLHITGGTITWDPGGLSAHLDATVGGHVQLALDGSFVDGSNWSFSATGGLTGDWSPISGVQLTQANSSVSGAVTDSNGTVTFAVHIALSGTWHTGPLTITGLTAGIGNDDAVPAYCPSGGTNGDVFLTVAGTGAVTFGTSPVSLAAQACINLSTLDWQAQSTANLAGLNPVPGLSIGSARLVVASQSGNLTATLCGSISARGIPPATGCLALLNGTDFIASLQVDLSSLGLPVSGTGDLIYSTAAIPDLGAIRGLDFGLSINGSPNPLSGISIGAPGFFALGDLHLSASLADFLKRPLKLSSPPTDLILTADLSSTPVITATLPIPGGVTLFQTSGGTSLKLSSVSLTISMGGGFGLAATADLLMPPPGDGSSTQPVDITLTAAISIQLVGVPSITVSLSKTGDTWHNAFGIEGLDLGDLAIQGGITFGTPVTPSIGFGAVINGLPSDWCNAVGIMGCGNSGGSMEPIKFVINISTANPIFDFQLGIANNAPALEPLAPISQSLGSDFTIDDASLIIAPFGGSVGPFVYTPGFHLRFDSKILGVALNVRADATISPASLTAHLDVGAISAGGISFRQTTFDLSVTPQSGLNASFDGGVTLGGSTLSANLKAHVGLDKSPSIDLNATVGNVGVGGFDLHQLTLYAHGDLQTLGALPSLTIGATASATVLGTNVTLLGDVVITPAGFTGFDLLAGPSAIDAGPLHIGGTGCDPNAIPAHPSFVSFPNDGPCVQVDVHLGANPLTVKINGSISVAGLTVSVSGSIDSSGIELDAAASLNLAGASAKVAVSGHVYYGDVSGKTDLNKDGNPVPVSAGDFRIAGSATISLLGFTFNASVAAGNIGGTQFATATGTFDALNTGYVHANLSVAGSFSHDSSGFHWSLDGSGGVSVGGTSYGDGLPLVNASVHADSGGHFTVSGGFSVGSIANAQVSATLNLSGNRVLFNLHGSASINVFGQSAAATVDVGTESPDGTPYNGFQLSASASLALLGDSVKIDGSVSFTTAGDFCINASVEILTAQGTGQLCTPGESNPGLHISFQFLGFSFDLGSSLTDLTHWWVLAAIHESPHGYIGDPNDTFHADAYADFGLVFAVSPHGFTVHEGGITFNYSAGLNFNGSGSVGFEACASICLGASIDISFSFPPPAFCVGASILGYGLQACWSSDNGLSVRTT